MLDEEIHGNIPPGFTPGRVFHRGIEIIHQVAWSPDGKLLAIAFQREIVEIRNPNTEELIHKIKMKNINYSLAWSPNGDTLACGQRSSIYLWSIKTGQLLHPPLKVPGKIVKSLAWSQKDTLLASGSDDGIIRLWVPGNSQPRNELTEHLGEINCLAWSPNGTILASAAEDDTIRFWNLETEQPQAFPIKGMNNVSSLAWSRDGKTLALALKDNTICLWDVENGKLLKKLEGHANRITSLALSHNEKLLASKSLDGTIYCWNYTTGERVRTLHEDSNGHFANLAFHPGQSSLATLEEKDRKVRIWDLDLDAILSHTDQAPYVSARAVLVGDKGVGKTSLALMLKNQPYTPPASIHSLSVDVIHKEEFKLDHGIKETREIILWDLGGQEHYHLTHQIYLKKSDITLVLFNPHSDYDSFIGVHYWTNVLQLAQTNLKDQRNPIPFLQKLLVATHVDLGEKKHSRQYSNRLIAEQKFVAYFETCVVKHGGVRKLKDSIIAAVNWDILPKLPFTKLFLDIRDFILELKKNSFKLSLVTPDDLLQRFLTKHSELSLSEELQIQFASSMKQLEEQGIVRTFRFSNFVLIKSELWDYYISALMNAVIEDEPEGSGKISEENALSGAFYIPEGQSLGDKRLERLLLIEILACLQEHEIAVQEVTNGNSYFIFPALATRDLTSTVNNKSRLIFHFRGSLDNIYTKLVIRLAQSYFFLLKKVGKDCAIFASYAEEYGKEVICGFCLKRENNIEGTLSLFWDEYIDEKVRILFEEYIRDYLLKNAGNENIQWENIYICLNCGENFPGSMIKRRSGLGFDTIKCSICETIMPLTQRAREVPQTNLPEVFVIDQAAETRRREAFEDAKLYSLSQEKVIKEEFDVFLCYSAENKSVVKNIRKKLAHRGIASWFDEEDIRPGLLRDASIEAQIRTAKSAAVFVGKEGIAALQQRETYALLEQFIKRNCPVIPIFLEDAPDEPQIPLFLKGMQRIDLRSTDLSAYLPKKLLTSRELDIDEERLLTNNDDDDPKDDWGTFSGERQGSVQRQDPIDLLVWGITGQRPESFR